MRLNGKRAIMGHVGYTVQNWRAWTMCRLRYGRCIYIRKASGKVPRYWAMSEELDAIDRENSVSVYDVAYDKLVAQLSTNQHPMVKARREREMAGV